MWSYFFLMAFVKNVPVSNALGKLPELLRTWGILAGALLLNA